jgi:serine/threonine-protein kinase
MAPEQAAADPDVDHRADIYAFGVTAYEMLVGQPPFAGLAPRALMAARMTEDPPHVCTQRPDVPRVLADLVMRCLERDPADRPQSAAELLAMLDDPAMVSGAFGVPTSETSRWKRWRGRHLLVALGLVLVAIAVATTSMLRRSSAPSSAVTAPPSSRVATGPARIVVLPLVSIGGD